MLHFDQEAERNILDLISCRKLVPGVTLRVKCEFVDCHFIYVAHRETSGLDRR